MHVPTLDVLLKAEVMMAIMMFSSVMYMMNCAAL
jgi:hypothetical protein